MERWRVFIECGGIEYEGYDRREMSSTRLSVPGAKREEAIMVVISIPIHKQITFPAALHLLLFSKTSLLLPAFPRPKGSSTQLKNDFWRHGRAKHLCQRPNRFRQCTRQGPARRMPSPIRGDRPLCVGSSRSKARDRFARIHPDRRGGEPRAPAGQGSWSGLSGPPLGRPSRPKGRLPGISPGKQGRAPGIFATPVPGQPPPRWKWQLCCVCGCFLNAWGKCSLLFVKSI